MGERPQLDIAERGPRRRRKKKKERNSCACLLPVAHVSRCMTHMEPHNGKTEEKSTCLISRPRAASQPAKMLEAHLEEGALCSFDGPGGAPRRCFAAQRTSWPASFSPSSSPCDCSKKKSARAYGRNGSVCVQSLHYSSHLLTMFNRGNYFFICSY